MTPSNASSNHMSGCLLCQNNTAKNPRTRWRRKGTGTPPPARRRARTPEPTPYQPGTPPTTAAPTGNTSGAQSSEIVNLPSGYTYSHTTLPWAELIADDEDTQHDTDFDPDMLTDEG